MHLSKKQYSVLMVDYMNYDSAAEIPYIYSRAGCTVTIFSDNHSWLLKNRFVDYHILCIQKDPRSFADQVVSVVNQGNYDYILLVDDVALRIMNDFLKDEKLALQILPLTKLDYRKVLGAKSGLSQFCKDNNFRTPRFLIADRSQSCDVVTIQMQEQLTAPLLVKIDQSQGGRGVFYSKNYNDGIQILQSLSTEKKDNVVIQEYVSGENLGMEAFFDKGNLIAYVFSRIEKTVDGEFGVSSERTYLPCPSIVKSEMMRFGKLLGAHGFASITFIHPPDTQDYYLIEFDSRINAWLRHALFVGVDFSRAIHAVMKKEAIILEPKFPQGKNSLVLWHFSRELLRSFFTRDIATIIKWCTNKEGRLRMIPWYDPKLVSSIMLRGVWVFIKRCKKKLIK